MNGTYVNDRKISGITTLAEGDRVRFGNTVWRMTGSATEAGADTARMPAGA